MKQELGGQAMAQFKVGIVGTGKLGNYHCNALTQIEEAELRQMYTGLL